MESGTQVQFQADVPEIIIASVGGQQKTKMVSAAQIKQLTTNIQKTNVPRVVIVTASPHLAGVSAAVGERKATVIGNHHTGGQTLQQPVPPRPIIIHPPNLTKMTVASAASANQGLNRQQNVSNVVEANQGRQQHQVMIIQQQQPSNGSNIQQELAATNNQPLIVTVADSGGRQEAQTIYPIQDSSTYTVYNEDGSSYSTPANYYSSNATVNYQQSPSTYIIQQSPQQHNQQGAGQDDDASAQLSHTTRASPATIQWLLQNYETAEGVSLPRCTLYSHYLKHCAENKLDPVNAASFGKLIRSVFLGLRTRRLGTRGNSKYHYYGIRIRLDSQLNKAASNEDTSASLTMKHQPATSGAASAKRNANRTQTPCNNNSVSQSGQNQSQSNTQPLAASTPGNTSGSSSSVCVTESYSLNEDQKSLLGQGAVPSIVPPSFELMSHDLQRIGLSIPQAEKFFVGYRQHCEDLLDCVKNLLFTDVESCWRQFWQTDENNPLEEEDDEESSDMNLTGLTRTQLYSMCTLQSVQEFIQTMDFQLYQVIVDVLVPNVLKPIPSNLTQSIRNFAKHLESGLSIALQGAPEIIIKLKLDAVSSLAQTLRRYTSLNHLAQAARAVLQNPTQITQMLTDLNRVDFRNVQEQASWVCFCNPIHVEEIEKSFKATLQKQNTLEQWADWLSSVVDQILSECRPLNELISSAKEFLLKWSFYSSMVMRDLTLRSAPSFGSFHLIRLLYDEYMFYLVEQRVARATGQSTVAVMSQSYRHHVHIDEMATFNNAQYSSQTSEPLPDHDSDLSYSNHHYQLVSGGDISSSAINLLPVSSHSSDECRIVIEQNGDTISSEGDGYLNGHADGIEEYFIPANGVPDDTKISNAQQSIDETLLMRNCERSATEPANVKRSFDEVGNVECNEEPDVKNVKLQ